MKVRTVECLATLSLRRGASWTPRDRLAVRKWLQQQAELVRTAHDQLAPRFTAKFWR